uniref:Uncharacterized protein n=1 Tax=Arundo donax TaxID=35708 RepID=A0A0A9CCT5_ARUDO
MLRKASLTIFYSPTPYNFVHSCKSKAKNCWERQCVQNTG